MMGHPMQALCGAQQALLLPGLVLRREAEAEVVINGQKPNFPYTPSDA